MGSESQPEPTPAGRRRPELEPRRGMRLGRYELLTLLASGGMAQVFIARLAGQHGFERLVALKTMRPEHAESDAFRRMFLDEAQLAARIRHVNVVEVLDLGDEQGIVYQAMTLVEGDSVAALLRRRRQLGARGLPHGVAARIVADVLSGLHAAHELTDADGRALHIVHRDVSPQNVLVSVDGIAKIADFGIAKARLRLADETDAGQIKGKFAYMAPEQLERRTTDRRADVFSTGVMLWEALTGKRLFGGIDLIE
ncbi:MAG TPA: serine/threonine-protein kinase, partial [Polyangiaceae bacterium]|nr:serine/threonine-protein kinase [Polyangiaceae bacterium]